VLQLASLCQLPSLELENPGLDTKDFEKLADLKSLEELRLTVFSVAGKYLSFLRDLPRLRRLVLGVKSDDEAIDQVAAATNLEYLSARLTDKTLPKLQKLTKLKALEIRLGATRFASGGITGETLPSLKHLPIRYLALQDSPLTETGLQQLLEMKGLVGLNLAWTKLTDKDVQALTALTSLRRLEIDCLTQTTPDAGPQPAASLPNCSIHCSRNCPSY